MVEIFWRALLELPTTRQHSCGFPSHDYTMALVIDDLHLLSSSGGILDDDIGSSGGIPETSTVCPIIVKRGQHLHGGSGVVCGAEG